MENGNIPAEAGNETTKTPETGNEAKTFTQEEANMSELEKVQKTANTYKQDQKTTESLKSFMK